MKWETHKEWYGKSSLIHHNHHTGRVDKVDGPKPSAFWKVTENGKSIAHGKCGSLGSGQKMVEKQLKSLDR